MFGNTDMAASKKVDYAQIEPGWRAGIKSPRQLAAEYCANNVGITVSHTSITKHFTKEGIPRDLKAKINAKAESLVNKAMVYSKGNKETLLKEKEIIDVNATEQADTLLGHRKDIKRHRALAISLLNEIEAQTLGSEDFARLGELLAAPDEKGIDKLNELYRKVISTPSRIDSMKKLSETLKNLIGLERQALGISDNANGDADRLPVTLQLSGDDANL